MHYSVKTILISNHSWYIAQFNCISCCLCRKRNENPGKSKREGPLRSQPSTSHNMMSQWCVQVLRENLKAFKSISSLDCLQQRQASATVQKLGILQQTIDMWKSGMFAFLIWPELPFNKTESSWHYVPSIYKCSRGPLNIKREQHKSLALSFILHYGYF